MYQKNPLLEMTFERYLKAFKNRDKSRDFYRFGENNFSGLPRYSTRWVKQFDDGVAGFTPNNQVLYPKNISLKDVVNRTNKQPGVRATERVVRDNSKKIKPVVKKVRSVAKKDVVNKTLKNSTNLKKLNGPLAIAGLTGLGLATTYGIHKAK